MEYDGSQIICPQIKYINENNNLKIHIKVIEVREKTNQQNTTYNSQILLQRKCMTNTY